MQDDDGGVWHKQTSEHFSGFVMPEDDKLPSEVIGTGSAPYKSTCATADFAAVAAIAARVYQPFDAQVCRAKSAKPHARRGSGLRRIPNVTFRNPPGICTGEYGDDNCGDETVVGRCGAVAHHRRAAYNDYFLKNYSEFLPNAGLSACRGLARSGADGIVDLRAGAAQGSGCCGRCRHSRRQYHGRARESRERTRPIRIT